MSGVELRVTEDLAADAVELFAEADPRSVALSGGTTPIPVYEALAKLKRFPWKDVDVFYTDERCVPERHPDSNHGMASRTLLSKVKAWPHPIRGCSEVHYESQLRAHFGGSGVPSFDLMFLGLGEDGHTASLFPGDKALKVTKKLCAKVERPDHWRVTLTLPVLSAAKLAIFLVSGESKRSALQKLVAGDESVPAARVAAERVIVLADPAAAGIDFDHRQRAHLPGGSMNRTMLE
jgi:6-phosphogluconolactonase